MRDQFDRRDLMIKEAFSQIQPAQEPELLPNVLDNLPTKGIGQRPKKVALILCAVLLLATMTAFALGQSGLLKLFARLDDEFSSFYQPVELSFEQQDIRLAVPAILCDSDQLTAYITLEDLTGDRLRNGIHLGISSFYTDSQPHTLTSHDFEQVHIDEETGIVTFLYQGYGFDVPNTEEVTFSFNDLYLNPREFQQAETGIDLSQASPAPETITLSGNDVIRYDNPTAKPSQLSLLKPFDQEQTIREISSHWVSNIGFVDGQLHVQVYTSTYIAGNFTLYLYDERGSQIACQALYQFDYDGSEADRGILEQCAFQEWIFDVSDPADLLGAVLKMDFTETERLAGSWSITVPVESTVSASVTQSCQITLDKFTISELKITPFNVILSGHCEEIFWLSEMMLWQGFALEVETADGERQQLTALQATEETADGELLYHALPGGGFMATALATEVDEAANKLHFLHPEGTITRMAFTANSPLTPEEITALTINGHRVELGQ